MTPSDPRFAAYLPHPDPAECHAPVTAVVTRATAGDVPVPASVQSRARGGTADAWAERIRRALRRERAVVITATVSGTTVGYASAAYLPEHAADGAPAGHYLTGVTVDPDWRRRGIARLLTLWRMDWVAERAPAVWCAVSAANRASLDLHRELGFDRVAYGACFQGIRFAAGAGWLLRAAPPRR